MDFLILIELEIDLSELGSLNIDCRTPRFIEIAEMHFLRLVLRSWNGPL